MINNLTGRAAIIKRYAIPPFEPYRMRCLPDRHEQLSAQLHIVESIQIFYMLLGHYQNMGRRFGMDIIKGCGNFILPNQTFGFAVGDGTKKTIIHVRIIHGLIAPPETAYAGSKDMISTILVFVIIVKYL